MNGDIGLEGFLLLGALMFVCGAVCMATKRNAMGVLMGPGSSEHGAVAAEAVKVSAPLGDDTLHFRARWAEQESAFIVNGNATASHSVMFDRFWSGGSAAGSR